MVDMKQHKTILTAKAEIVTKTGDESRAIASKYGLDAHPQMDLLYVRSCLVSAGSKAGINANDDTFTREATWAARFSPVLKPANWQHNDRDILGVVYSVEARDLNGTILDLESDTPPDCEFEFWTEAVVYKLIQPERAGEIETRAQAGELFVSMEAWFDDYQYGLLDTAGKLEQLVTRTAETSYLDNHLKANRGTGQFKGQRLVRVLSNITFGGYGFVDEPANKRSIISDVQSTMSGAASTRDNDDIIVRIRELLDNCEPVRSTEEIVMNANASDQSRQPIDGKGVEAAVEVVLDRKAANDKAAADKLALQTRATAAEAAQADSDEKAKEAEKAQVAKEAELAALQTQVDEFNETIDEAIQAEAGATGSTPAEIAAIDAASDGAGAFAAKLAWLTKSRAALKVRAERADELEGQLAEASKQVRAGEVRGLFADILSDEEVEAFVVHAATLDEDAYGAWRDQQEILVLAVAAKPAFLEKKEEKDGKGKDDKKKKKKEAKADEVGLFAALLENRRTEAEGLLNHPGGEDLTSGVSPAGLKVPRHKIAGATEGDDTEDPLANVQADDQNVNLAGAADGGGDSEVDIEDGFRTLAAEVTSSRKATAKKAPVNFDPTV